MSTKPELPVAIDSTMLNTFRACRRKFNYSFLNSYQLSEKSIHLIAGGAFAAGCEAARLYWFNPDRTSDHFDDLLGAAFIAFSKEWGTADHYDSHNKSFANTFYALIDYLTNYHPAIDVIQPLIVAGKPQVEFSFAIPLNIFHPNGDPFIFCGRFDMLGKWDNLPVVLDEKTTVALGESWRKQWELRGQFLGYCWACQQLGYPVNTAIVRGIGLLKTTISYMTVPQQYPQHVIDRWRDAMLRTILDMKFAYTSETFDYNFGDACSSYGGCAYSLLCSAKEPTEWVSHYQIRHWNPLHRGVSSES